MSDETKIFAEKIANLFKKSWDKNDYTFSDGKTIEIWIKQTIEDNLKQNLKQSKRPVEKCKHNKGTFYSPETGVVCQGCKQKLISIQVTEKEANEFKNRK